VADGGLDGPGGILVGPPSPIRKATERQLAATGVRLRVLDHDPDRATLSSAVDKIGGLDLLVRLAPEPLTGSLAEVPSRDWNADLARLLGGAQQVVIDAAGLMGKKGGSIVLVGSVDAFHAYPQRSTASAAMAGLLGLVRSLGVELAPRGIRANAVLAGPLEPAPAPSLDADDPLVARTLLRSPSHRFVSPNEVAAAIGFLLGPDSAFMTGQALRVDGGWASLNQAPDGMRFQ
jgi:3-oxoacyl-[acyl-carrier protein] reductase